MRTINSLPQSLFSHRARRFSRSDLIRRERPTNAKERRRNRIAAHERDLQHSTLARKSVSPDGANNKSLKVKQLTPAPQAKVHSDGSGYATCTTELPSC